LHKDDTIRLVQDKSCSPEARFVSLERSTLLQMLEGVSGKARSRTRSPDSRALPGMPGFLSRNWNGWAEAHQ
ncbi:hypothetical protein FQV23_0010338, partial [Spheniscus humboldti]